MTPRRAAGAVLLLLTLLVAGAGLARALGAQPPATLQERTDAVSATIRCPTCQGLSVKDSPSVLATGSREIVEQQLSQGRTPDQVRAYFVERYGPSALLSPDTRGPGLLVWLVPAVLIPVAGLLGWRRLRSQDVPAVALGSTEADADAASALQAFRTGALDPDDSPAGEVLREALTVRLAVDVDGLGADEADRADLRLAAAYRRYERRARTVPDRSRRPDRPARGVAARTGPASRGTLPRRAVTAVAALTLVVGATAALAVGTRERGAGDLPTGDLPGTVAEPGIGELQAATRTRPQDPQAWVALGRAYDATAELSSAIAAYDRALALDASADDVQLLRAGVLMRGGSVREALPVLTDLERRYPADPDTVLLLGLAQQRLEQPAAAATLRRYLELEPAGPGAETARALLAAP